MFSSSPPKSRAPVGAKGHRAYVIGDIHGRLDLLEELLAKIDADLTARPARRSLLVSVGDLIDRGPQSAQVIERLRTYRRRGVKPMFLLGNHEEVLLRILDGDQSLIPSWLRFGGIQCLRSYGVDAEAMGSKGSDSALAVIRAAVPKAHVEFLQTFIDTCRFGDYLFVHAGIRPGIELEQQSQTDLRWIREPFLFDETDHGFVVVHGHTISRSVEERGNRIGIDTGAYRSGVLTALVIDGAARRYIDTKVADDASIRQPVH